MGMKFLDPSLSFDENKPFYPLVINMLVQVHGLNELASRGIKSTMDKMDPAALKTPPDLEGKNKEAWERVRAGGKTGLLGKLQLQSKVTGQSIDVDIEALADEYLWKYESPLAHFNRMSAGSLLILAWEITKAHHTTDPLWEFLRHCRNAAAHRGHFNFYKGEPKYPAHWRGLTIQNSLQSQPLFFAPPITGFFGPGDPLYLLWDIEQAYPSLT